MMVYMLFGSTDSIWAGYHLPKYLAFTLSPTAKSSFRSDKSQVNSGPPSRHHTTDDPKPNGTTASKMMPVHTSVRAKYLTINRYAYEAKTANTPARAIGSHAKASIRK